MERTKLPEEKSSANNTCASMSLEPSEAMFLHHNKFDGWRGHKRHPTIHFVAVDRPWDEINNNNNNNNSSNKKNNNRNEFVFIDALNSSWERREEYKSKYVELERTSITHKPLLYILGKEAAPFTSLLCTLAYAAFNAVPDLQLHTNNQWLLKWIGRPVMSDFVKVNLRLFQKLNHFPETWRLGKKDELQKHMRELEQGECNTSICPQGWILPDEVDDCLAILRAKENVGKMFICKPTTSACGRGIVLIKGRADVQLPMIKDNNSICITDKFDAFSNIWATTATTTHNDKISVSKESIEEICNDGSEVNRYTQNYQEQRLRVLKERAQKSLRFARPLRWVVQRYVDDPYLINGYKFDLRLYVVVTSYAPFRLYVYKEGLVRIATSPYYVTQRTNNKITNNSNNNSNCNSNNNSKCEESCRQQHHQVNKISTNEQRKELYTIVDETCLTAHLTNFTVNKQSNTFVTPAEEFIRIDNVKHNKNEEEENESSCNKIENESEMYNNTVKDNEPEIDKRHNEHHHMSCASKWSLHTLGKYLEENGVDWTATMESVYVLLRSVFASIAPHVRRELEKLDVKLHSCSVNGGSNNNNSSNNNDGECDHELKEQSTRAPCTHHGVSPYFQIFGVDVLLRCPKHKASNSNDNHTLCPVLMEVNIMPSLSTHYSWLDQHIKGNFIADTLTLIGLTPLYLTTRCITNDDNENNENNNKSVHTTSDVSSTNGKSNYSCNDVVMQFMNRLNNVHEREACMTAEEELQRSLPNFTRLYPSCHTTEENKTQLRGVNEPGEKLSSWQYNELDDLLHKLEMCKCKA